MIILPIILTGVMFLTLRFVMLTADDPSGHRENEPITYIAESDAGTRLQSGNYTQIDAAISLFQSDIGEYIIVLPDHMLLTNPRHGRMHLVITLSLFLLAIIFITNYTLTKRISRSIMIPINTLRSGVHEISAGNLAYRIDYNKGNEFDQICTDFNEMASRLSDMVRARQLDEQSRRELIAGISHDLRTPLTSIKAYIEGLREGVASNPEMQEKYLTTIQSKTADMEYIISQLFLFSKLDVGGFPFHLETVEIGSELSKLITGLADEYRDKRLHISLEENVEGKYVSIDTVQFRNVIQNILNNCVKYCGSDNPQAKISCRADRDIVSITITDNGIGLPDESLPKVFDIFYRSDTARSNPSQGSGLGLAISSKIIQRLNGTITAENAPEGGLSIIISLPIAKGAEQ